MRFPVLKPTDTRELVRTRTATRCLVWTSTVAKCPVRKHTGTTDLVRTPTVTRSSVRTLGCAKVFVRRPIATTCLVPKPTDTRERDRTRTATRCPVWTPTVVKSQVRKPTGTSGLVRTQLQRCVRFENRLNSRDLSGDIQQRGGLSTTFRYEGLFRTRTAKRGPVRNVQAPGCRCGHAHSVRSGNLQARGGLCGLQPQRGVRSENLQPCGGLSGDQDLRGGR